MLRTVVSLCLVVPIAIFALGGCGGPDAADGQQNGNGADNPAADVRDGEPTADEAVLAVLDGLTENHPEAVWEFLPASYQRDVTDLVHEFAGRMDAEVWNRMFATSKRLTTSLLKNKQAFILENEALLNQPTVNPAEIVGLVGLVDTVLDSDVADLERLKTIDVGKFLKTTGGGLMREMTELAADSPNSLRAQLANSSVRLISQDGDRAVIEFESTVAPRMLGSGDGFANPDGGNARPPAQRTSGTRQVEFVRVEGKWIPKNLADNWRRNIDGYRARMQTALAPDNVAAFRETMLVRLDAVDRFVATLETAKTAQDLNLLLVFQVMPTVAEWIAQAQNAPPLTAGDNSETARVLILVELDETAAEAMAARLESFIGVDSEVVGPDVAAGTTAFTVTPVKDLEALGRKLQAVGFVKVDAEKRIITVTPADIKEGGDAEKTGLGN